MRIEAVGFSRNLVVQNVGQDITFWYRFRRTVTGGLKAGNENGGRTSQCRRQLIRGREIVGDGTPLGRSSTAA